MFKIVHIYQDNRGLANEWFALLEDQRRVYLRARSGRIAAYAAQTIDDALSMSTSWANAVMTVYNELGEEATSVGKEKRIALAKIKVKQERSKIIQGQVVVEPYYSESLDKIDVETEEIIAELTSKGIEFDLEDWWNDDEIDWGLPEWF